MKSAEMLSRVFVWTTCLLFFNISILPSLFSPIAVASSSGNFQDEIQNYFNKNEKEKDDSVISSLESIWKTFKDVIDSTSNVLSSSLSSPGSVSSYEKGTSAVSSDRDISDEMIDRRGFLMEQSLTEHYMQQFFDFFPQLNEHRSMAEEEDSVKKSQSKASTTDASIKRWVQPDSIDGSTRCFCFSASPDSYWSFEWCPEKATIYQGRRMYGGEFLREYDLGKRLSLPKRGNGARLESTSDTQYLLKSAKAKYPTAVAIHLYQDGDTCVESGSHQRVSVVVLNERTSSKCASGNGEMFIESVVEARVCQYILHVCLDSWNERLLLRDKIAHNAKDNGGRNSSSTMNDVVTESRVREINETLHYIKNHIIGSFARKTRADAQGMPKANVLTSLHSALPPFPQTRIEANLKLIKDMFMHAYDSYIYNGYPATEVKPISCGPASFNLVKIPGLTLIDSLDTLVILGNYTEFARSVERLRFLNDNVYEETGIYTAGRGLFDINYNVSVFETNIRVLGGLLSAHQLAAAFLKDKVLEKDVWAEDKSILSGTHHREGKEDKDRFWVYDDFLLNLAQDIGDRLLPAFDTKTGIPIGTVNLIYGIPEGETDIASLAGGGTLSLEMELLSRLTGDNKYGRAAKLATRAFWMRRSAHGLLGKHICTRSGAWAESLSGIGSNSDSFYEYLIKHNILFPEDYDFWLQLVAAYGGIYNETRNGEWYGDVDMMRGKKQKGVGRTRTVFEALMAFYPGMQVLLGEITPAARTLNSFFLVREYLGFLPERFDYGNWRVDSGGGIHYLRPELLESAYFLHRSSKGFQNQFRSRLNNHTSDSSGWLWSGDFALHTLQKLTRTECGYASVRNVSPKTSGNLNADRNRIRLIDEMPSFFLSETLKYLYLLFDDKNILHTDEDRDWVFTTEAHPIHHEGKDVSVDVKLKKQARELKSRIQRRLNGRKKPNNELPEGLLEEKWTEQSKVSDFAYQLEPLITNDANLYQNRRVVEGYNSQNGSPFSTAVERLFPKDNGFSPFDVYSERIHTLNPTYLSFRKLGNEVDLTSSCPNLYASNFLWIRALNGGIADYSDTFKSTMDDDFRVSESDIIQLGSVDALALHGAGVHIQALYDSFFQIRNPIRDQKTSKTKTQRASKNTPTRQERNGLTRFDMGDGMGSFDVAAFEGGSGFFVQHVESGETIVTTMIEEEQSIDSNGPMILVYSTSDTGVQASRKSRDKNGANRRPRAVVLADVHGNSYSCQVQIMESMIHTHEDSTCDARASASSQCIGQDTEDKIVHEFPCSPALFGPTHTLHLQRVESIDVKAHILPLDPNDKHGCGHFSMSGEKAKRLDDSLSNEKSPVISLVDRGDCTFQEKSYYKKLTEGSEGVIVVNNNKGDDLFVMSGGGAEVLESLDREDYPVTVLVTWDDGQKIMEAIQAHGNKSKNTQITARISLVHDHVPLDSELEGDQSKFWPRVRASTEALQIYSKSGWGVHAAQILTEREPEELQWQLYLMKHDMGDETVP